MKSLDLRGVKKIASDGDTTTLEHPSGHKIVVVHKLLSAEHKKALDLLPAQEKPKAYAEGGEVDDSQDLGVQGGPDVSRPDTGWGKIIHKAEGGEVETDEPMHPEAEQAQDHQSPEKVSAAAQKALDLIHHTYFGYSPGEQIRAPAPMKYADGGSVANPVAPSQDLTALSQAPAADATPDAPVDTAPAAVAPTNPYAAAAQVPGQFLQQGFNQETAGQLQAAAAKGAEGKEAQVAAQQSNTRLAAIQADAQNNLAKYQALSDKAIQAMNEGQINPNDYQEHQGVGSKILSGLGMIISGIGAKASGQPNMAQQYLDQQITRNIDAQKANLSNKNNVLHGIMEQGHTLDEATQLMKGIELQKQANDMAALAGKYAGPQAQAAAQAFIGQRKQQAAQAFGQVAMNKAMWGASQGNAQGAVPDQVDPNLALSYKVGGQKHYAKSPAEAEDYNKQAQALDALEQQAVSVANFNKNVGRTGPLTENNGKAEAINAPGAVLLTKTLTSGGAGLSRLATMFKDSMPQAGSLNQATQRGKLQQTLKMIAQERDRLKAAGLGGNIAPVPIRGAGSQTAKVSNIPDSEQ